VPRRHPAVLDPARVGSYPARAFAGGGYVWDEVLEYRVWCHDRDDDYYAFATYREAAACAKRAPGAEEVLALVLQREYIDEPSPGDYRHVEAERVTEWPVEFLSRPRRTARTIPEFLAPDAPANRFEILRGSAPRAGGRARRGRRGRAGGRG
jgi:putative acetyltransferase